MKTNKLIEKYSFISLLVLLAILSIVISIYTYFYYIEVSQGAVGLATLYLMSYFIRNTKIDIPLREVLLHPNKEKYLLFAFVIPAISCWATIQILETLIFLYRQTISN